MESSASKPIVLRGEETHGVQTTSPVALLQRLVLHGCPQGPTKKLHWYVQQVKAKGWLVSLGIDWGFKSHYEQIPTKGVSEIFKHFIE